MHQQLALCQEEKGMRAVVGGKKRMDSPTPNQLISRSWAQQFENILVSI